MRSAVNLVKSKVKKAGGGSYEYWVLRWYDVLGKYRGKTLGRADRISKRQAQKFQRAKVSELETNPGRRNVSRSKRLGGYLADYLKNRKTELRPGTFELHEISVRYLKAYFGETVPLEAIDRSQARAFKAALANGELAHINQRQRNLTASGVDLYIRNARKMFADAVDDDLILFNPFDRLGGSKPVSSPWKYQDLTTLGKLIEASPSDSWRLLLALCRLAGLRRGEALAARWVDIDWDKKLLHVRPYEGWAPKDSDPRKVPLRSELYGLMLACFEKAEPGSETIIPKGTVNARNISRDFKVICRRADVPTYSKPLHTLRKSCLTDWAGRYPQHVVTEWAGHADPKTTNEYYLKISEADYERAAGERDELLHKKLHKSAFLGKSSKVEESQVKGK